MTWRQRFWPGRNETRIDYISETFFCSGTFNPKAFYEHCRVEIDSPDAVVMRDVAVIKFYINRDQFN